MLAAAAEASLELIRGEEWRREHLRKLIASWAGAARDPSRAGAFRYTDSALILGDNERALATSAALRERGILVPAIRPPTVPEGTARLRISLSAAHSAEDLARLAAALREACRSGAEAHA